MFSSYTSFPYRLKISRRDHSGMHADCFEIVWGDGCIIQSPTFQQIRHIECNSDLCKAGERFDDRRNGCVKCEKGTYQDKQGAFECKKCAEGQTTISTGSPLARDCIRKLDRWHGKYTHTNSQISMKLSKNGFSHWRGSRWKRQNRQNRKLEPQGILSRFSLVFCARNEEFRFVKNVCEFANSQTEVKKIGFSPIFSSRSSFCTVYCNHLDPRHWNLLFGKFHQDLWVPILATPLWVLCRRLFSEDRVLYNEPLFKLLTLLFSWVDQDKLEELSRFHH